MTDSYVTDPTPTPVSLAPDDPRTYLAAAVRTATEVLSNLSEAHHGLPTPCDSMNVAELAEHVVMALRRVACAGRAVPPGEWPTDAADVAPGRWADALAVAAHDVEEAWSDPALLVRPTALPWGTFPGAEVLGIYTSELVVHAWDLARATGQAPEWDDAAIEAALAVMRGQLPTPVRGALWDEVFAGLPDELRAQPPFADAVEVSTDAPLIDQLVAWNGRDPRWPGV